MTAGISEYEDRRWAVSIGAGPNQRPLVEAAIEAGYSIIAVGHENSLHFIDLHIPISTFDTEAVCARVCSGPYRNQIKVVLTRSSGPALVTGSELSRSLGLRGHAPELAGAAVDKLELAQLCEKWGIGTPRTWLHTDESWRTLGVELIVKPNQPTRGKAGVRRVSLPQDFTLAVSEARRHSLDDNAIIQESLPERDICSLLLVDEGEVVWQHHFEESVTQMADGTFSTGGHAELRDEVRPEDPEFFCRVAECVRTSQHSGFLLLSYRSCDAGCFLYEINTGLAGDQLAERFSGASTGVDLFEAEVMTLGSPTGLSDKLPPSHLRLFPESR